MSPTSIMIRVARARRDAAQVGIESRSESSVFFRLSMPVAPDSDARRSTRAGPLNFGSPPLPRSTAGPEAGRRHGVRDQTPPQSLATPLQVEVGTQICRPPHRPASESVRVACQLEPLDSMILLRRPLRRRVSAGRPTARLGRSPLRPDPGPSPPFKFPP
jgi:hypothetical protein